MNEQFSCPRRFTAALVALLLAGMLFRPQITDALIVRGDDYLYRGDPTRAIDRYRRAITIWPGSETAVDRYVFLELQQNTQPSLRDGEIAAAQFLSRHADDATILSDRALCFLHEKRYALAEADFEHAARVTHTAQNYVFAGWAAQHAGRTSAARAFWSRALAVQPRYRPALIALAEHQR